MNADIPPSSPIPVTVPPAILQPSTMPAPPPIPTSLPALKTTPQECKLYASNATKALYPKGFLELAAQQCWAGENTDILVVGKRDVLPVYNEHARINQQTMDVARSQMRKIIPPELDALLGSAQDKNGSIIHRNILGAALSDTGSFAMSYQFNAATQKKLFVTVVDPIYHIHDSLAGIGGLTIGSLINNRLHDESDILDRPSMRAFTFAHESGHGAHAHGQMIVENGKMIKPDDPLLIDKMHYETEADVDAHKLYKSALQKGVQMSAVYPAIDLALRAVGSYYAGRHGELPFAHATNFGLHPEFETTKPEAQVQGVKDFRRELDKATGEAILNPENGQIKDGLLEKLSPDAKDSVLYCADEASETSTDKKLEWDDYTEKLGTCLAKDFGTKFLAVNGAIELDLLDDNPLKSNKVAKIFADDFKSAVSANILSSSAMGNAAKIYEATQQEKLPAESRAHWDSVFGLGRPK